MPTPGSRAWPLRGLTDPPWFGRSLPDEWLESTVIFGRPALATDHHGGLTSSGPVTYLTCAAHVDWGQSGEPSGPYDLGIGIVSRKMLRIVMSIPEDTAHIPRKGDTIEWTDDLGQTFRSHVRNVHSPQGLADHLEVESEAFR